MPYSESAFRDLVLEHLDEDGFDKNDAKAFFDAFKDSVRQVVAEADKAKIPGLGTLNCNVREKRKARNPATGETFMAPAKIALRFSIEKPLKDSVPSIKKGRSLIEQRESEKAKTKKKSGKRAAGRPPGRSANGARRGPGRPKGSGTKTKTAKTKAKAKVSSKRSGSGARF